MGGLPGLLIGSAVSHATELLDHMAALKDYTTSCNNRPQRVSGYLALRHRHRLVERSLALVLSNLELLDAFFARYSQRFVW
jgi:aspartate/methionine/tyrosine aminotransferase